MDTLSDDAETRKWAMLLHLSLLVGSVQVGASCVEVASKAWRLEEEKDG